MKTPIIFLTICYIKHVCASSAQDISEDELERKYDIRVIGQKFRADAAATLAKREKEIDKVNNDPNSKFKEKVGEFSDMDESEMKEHFGMLDDEDIANAELEARGLFTGMDFSQLEKHDPENEFKLRKLMNRIADQQEELPEYYDARDHGLVTGPKRQKACGSCYAFAGAAVHETALLKAGADLTNMDLSEQFLIDCGVSLQLNGGCDGGLLHKQSALVVNLGGYSPSESAWPYEMRRKQCPSGGTCDENVPYHHACHEIMSTNETWNNTGVQITDYGYCSGTKCSPELLKHIIWKYGSAGVSVKANGNWGNYASGVLEGYTCTKGSPHAVQAIGWGQDEATGIPYWIIKNSWGPNWGENGFAKIQQGQCNVDQGYMSWAEATLTDTPVANPEHFCDLSNFDGGMTDGIHNIRFRDMVDCQEVHRRKACKKMGMLGQLVEYVRETRVHCSDNICRCGLAKKRELLFCHLWQ